MDMQQSAATRVRQILQAMERSIDSARSRRVIGDSPVPASAPAISAPVERAGERGMHTPIGAPRAPEPRNAPSHPALSPPASTPGAAGQQVIGGGPRVAPPSPGVPAPVPNDPTRPQRLKAKPKRFESTFAAQYGQNPDAYRSQTG